MNSEANFIMEIWNAVRDHLPAGRRSEAAAAIMQAAAEYGWDGSDLSDIIGEDDILTSAFEDAFDPADEIDDDWEGGRDDDED